MKRFPVILLLALLPLLAHAGMSISPGTPSHTHADANTGGASLSGTTCTNCTITGGSVSATTTLPASAGASWVLLQTVSASGVPQFDCTTFSSTYSVYKIIGNFTVSADAATLSVRMSSDGSTYYAGTSYDWNVYGVDTAPSSGAEAATSDSEIGITTATGVDNTAGQGGYRFELTLFDPGSTSAWKYMLTDATYLGGVANSVHRVMGGAALKETSAVTALRVFVSSGSMSGAMRCYGLKDS